MDASPANATNHARSLRNSSQGGQTGHLIAAAYGGFDSMPCSHRLGDIATVVDALRHKLDRRPEKEPKAHKAPSPARAPILHPLNLVKSTRLVRLALLLLMVQNVAPFQATSER